MPRSVPRQLARTAAASLLVTVALSSAQPALAAPTAAVRVPCSPAALAAAITGAVSDETLQLASSCRYVLTAPLPAVSQNLTIQGRKATLERSPLPATAQFGILTVAAGNLAVSQLNFRNGYGGAITFDPLTTGSFTGNTGGAINFGQFATGGLSVTRSAFTRNTGGAINATWSNYGATLTGTTFTGPLTVTGDTFTGNTGGGINCEDNTPYCDFSITRSTFTRNTGSGISSVVSGPNMALTVTDSAFTGNSAADGGGIDINSLNGTAPIVTGDTFTGNSATAAGGAIYDTNADVTATGDTFTGNTAPAGGGIANEGEATVTVTGSTFLRNAAVSAGGAIYNQCVAAVTGTTFDQNTARSGGGGAIEQEAGCFGILTLSLTRSQVLGNSAGIDGGGIDNPAAFGTVTLTDSQVRGNSARSSGGGIYTSGPGPVTLTSSLVQANRPDNCAPADSVPGCTG